MRRIQPEVTEEVVPSAVGEEKKAVAGKLARCAEFYDLKKVLSGDLSPLKTPFNEEEINFLYREETDYAPKIITRKTLSRYFPPPKIEALLNGDTPFYDKVKKLNYGKFELPFADKLLYLMNTKNISKETKFNFEEKMTPCIGGYDIRFMTDQEYKDGVMFYFGEFADNCESIGKSGGDLCLFDAFSSHLRTFLIRKDNVIIGQSPVFINAENDTFVIASMISTPNADTKIIKDLTEYLAVRLLELNPAAKKITIGIGGANLISMGFKCFTRSAQGKPTTQFDALGKIRHASNVSDLAAEISICQTAIKYPILPDFDRLGPPDIHRFLQSPTGARKDFFRVACIVDRAELIPKKITVLANLAQTQKKIESKVAGPTKTDHTQERVKNASRFMLAISKLIKSEFPEHMEITLSKGDSAGKRSLSFSITGLPEGGKHLLLKKLSEYSGTAISATAINPEETNTIKFSLPLGFFSLSEPGDPRKKNQCWQAFCRKITEQIDAKLTVSSPENKTELEAKFAAPSKATTKTSSPLLKHSLLAEPQTSTQPARPASPRHPK